MKIMNPISLWRTFRYRMWILQFRHFTKENGKVTLSSWVKGIQILLQGRAFFMFRTFKITSF